METHYAVIVDAGSSGSRVYIYSWEEGENVEQQLDSLPKLHAEPDWVLKVKKGISTYAGKEASIWDEHLSELIAKAEEVVPLASRSDTPFYFLATAGLRLLPDNDQESILKTVCRNLQEKTSFLIPDCETHVAVIDGQAEGLYGWLALNYLIHNRDDGVWTKDEFSNTYGFMDMGGASAQIAFVPNATEIAKHSEDLHNVTLRTLGGETVTWDIFVNTWLGFGANQAQKRWRDLLVSKLNEDQLDPMKSGSPIPVIDPCLPARAIEYTITEIAQAGDNSAELLLYGEGAFLNCMKELKPMLNDHLPCKDEPCLFNGVHVPAFDFTTQRFVGVSEYWYTAQDLFQLDGKFDYATFTDRATAFCDSSWDEIHDQFLENKFGAMTEQNLKQSCFKSAWVLTILQDGFKFPLSPDDPNAHHNFLDTFQSAAHVEGSELSWCLGKAVLYASSRVKALEGESEFVGMESYSGFRVYGGEVQEIPLKSSIGSGMSTRNWPIIIVALVILLFVIYLYFKTQLKHLWKSSTNSLRNKWHSFQGYSRAEANDTIFQRPSMPRTPSSNMSPYGIPLTEFHVGSSTSKYPMSGMPSRVGSRVNINEEWA